MMEDNGPAPGISEVTVLSGPKEVRMADEWFGLATLNHFWIKRRFAVCRALLDRLALRSLTIAEVGCGHGVVQRQLEDQWDVTVDGFDLNMSALRRRVSRRSKVYYYDVEERRAEFEGRYDLIVLFDVIEHVPNEESFLEAVLFHLKKDGLILINVPADMRLYSQYDVVVGHLRRYSIDQLQNLACRTQLRIKRWTYWGLPFYPLLIFRKLAVRNMARSEAITAGFSPRGALTNFVLQGVGRLERIPQHIGGTSLMSIVGRA